MDIKKEDKIIAELMQELFCNDCHKSYPVTQIKFSSFVVNFGKNICLQCEEKRYEQGDYAIQSDGIKSRIYNITTG